MNEKKAKKLLDHVKGTYDNIAEEFSQTRHYIGREFESFLPYLQENGKIIDLGCGNGRFAAFVDLKKLQHDYLGIDNSKELIAIAKKKYPQHHFIEADQLSIPAEEESTEIIVNIRAFHHLPSKKTRAQALQEMHRVLKKEGIVIITVWNLWQKKYWKQLVSAFFRSIFTLGSYQFNDTFIPWKKKQKRYYHAFTKSEFRQVILKNKFHIIKQFEIGKDLIIIAQK